MHVRDSSTASLNFYSYLTKECSISDEIFITLVDEMQPVSFLVVYCNLQCILISKDTECYQENAYQEEMQIKHISKWKLQWEYSWVCRTALARVTDLLLTAIRISIWSEHLLFFFFPSVFLNQANFSQNISGNWDSDLPWYSLAFLWGEKSSQAPFIFPSPFHYCQLCFHCGR